MAAARRRPTVAPMNSPQNATPTTVVIADRSAAMRAALVRMFAAEPGLRLVGEAEDAAGILRLLRRERPDALVVDPGALGPGGLQSLPLLRGASEGTKIIVADFPEGPAFTESVLRLGADAFVAKGTAPDAWFAAIRSALGDSSTAASAIPAP